MASVFSTRFIASSQGSSGGYTCPPGYRAVLRHVSGCNRSSSPQQLLVVLVGSPNIFIVDSWLPATASATPGNSLSWEGRFVFSAGEQLAAVDNPGIDLTASGYLLTLP